MSRLPEKGEAAKAAATLTARVTALVGEESTTVLTGPILLNRRTGEIQGDMDQTLAAYGDLMDVGDALADGGGLGLVLSTLNDIETADTPSVLAALTSVYLQGLAIGVLMERARWQA